jgi:hypothetical protein
MVGNCELSHPLRLSFLPLPLFVLVLFFTFERKRFSFKLAPTAHTHDTTYPRSAVVIVAWWLPLVLAVGSLLLDSMTHSLPSFL